MVSLLAIYSSSILSQKSKQLSKKLNSFKNLLSSVSFLLLILNFIKYKKQKKEILSLFKFN